WGPARAYPLLLGTTAAGFAHAAVSTARPVALGNFAALEAQVLWGILGESDYFDTDPDNDRRLLSGLILSLRPYALPGFTFGAASLVHSDLQSFSAGDLANFAQFPVEEAGGNVEGNGLGALFADWAIPGSGFRAYGEWARDDYSLTYRDLIAEPDHAQAYTLGFEQTAVWGAGLLRLSGEFARISRSEPAIRDGRPYAVFYTHAGIRQGHTHEGQLLGASIGPGSDAQRVALDMVDSDGALWGGWVERVRWDDDAYVRFKSEEYGREGHDIELTVGLRHLRKSGPLQIAVKGALGFRRNRGFINLVGPNPPMPWETNLFLETRLVWVPEQP
ncbi:MAG: hypothetical protein ACE5GJ_02975, partial [Gemmatimonadota bacterium]